MKTYIKSSFLAVLFMAVFCVGMSSAYAKNINTNPNNAVFAQNINHEFNANSAINLEKLLRTNDSNCESSTRVLSNATIIFVGKDCSVTVIAADGTIVYVPGTA